MGSGVCLQVIVRVPIAVKGDHRVRCGQIDSNAAGFGAQQEAVELVWLGVEVVDSRLPFSCACKIAR